MDDDGRSRVSREEWARRVERWRDSGLSAAEFAAELGINARTLTYWKWVFGKEARGEKRVWPSRKTKQASHRDALPAPASIVEVHAVARDDHFELELGGGRRVRVPSAFDAEGLRRLLQVLEAS